MNLPIILATQVTSSDMDARDLAFARLGEFVTDLGDMLANIARLTCKPQIAALADDIGALHRTPDGNDAEVIRSAIGLLDRLTSELCAIPPDVGIVSPVHEVDGTILKELDAAVRYAGACAEDQAKALRRLLEQ